MYDDQSKTYSIKTQECVFELLNSNATTSRISLVITSVLKLVGLKPNKFPSVSSLNNMNVQSLILAQTKLAEKFSEQQSTCLLSDETSKYEKKN